MSRKKSKARATIQLAWFGSADVVESVKEITKLLTHETDDGKMYQKDMGATTLTLTDGSPIHFYNSQFVGVISKCAKLYEV